MSEIKTKPFDLENALNGDMLITRDGLIPTKFKKFEGECGEFNYVAYFVSRTVLYTPYGTSEDSKWDLFLLVEAPDTAKTEMCVCSNCKEHRGISSADACVAANAHQLSHKPPKSPYYNRGKIEVKAFIADQALDFFLGNAVKYVCRAGFKSKETEIQDLQKAIHNIEDRIEYLNNHGI